MGQQECADARQECPPARGCEQAEVADHRQRQAYRHPQGKPLIRQPLAQGCPQESKRRNRLEYSPSADVAPVLCHQQSARGDDREEGPGPEGTRINHGLPRPASLSGTSGVSDGEVVVWLSESLKFVSSRPHTCAYTRIAQ